MVCTGSYIAMLLATGEGVVVVYAQPSLGERLLLKGLNCDRY